EEKEMLFYNLRISVFVDANRQAAFEAAVGDAYGCISYVDKYQQIAMDFIERYPFTKFMDERHVDYDTSLVRKGVDINVFMLGFGKTSREIFFTSVANNQFLCEGANGPSLKQVNYYIFDKKNVKENGSFNCSYYRYADALPSYNTKDYLPLPALPANEEYFQLDVRDDAVLDIVKRLVQKKTDVNFAVVAFGTDLENIALAKKLLKSCEEWQVDNLVVFVKSKEITKEESGIKEENCLFIGNEKECVFNLQEILGDRIYRMSQLRNAIYNLEYDITSGNVNVTKEYVRKNSENAMKDWFTTKSQIERDSSTYGCLSLRSKLHLMGLDYCGVDENALPALTEQEYLSLYAKGDMPDLATYKVKADGKPIVNYTVNFPDSRRKTLAIHEHSRWNSFMLSKGMVPATKQQILEEQGKKNGKLCYTNGKNYAAHRHGNLTTFEGLIEFRQMVAKRDGCDEADKDVIKYDYQLLDDAYWLVSKCGCKIIYKQ
ncbi:MAG: hypothetical protein J6Q67_01605, partial [Clostridia bacterium]|nr:hypothetical protein [Clostridia bacterium]